jgi:hypothetical protein
MPCTCLWPLSLAAWPGSIHYALLSHPIDRKANRHPSQASLQLYPTIMPHCQSPAIRLPHIGKLHRHSRRRESQDQCVPFTSDHPMSCYKCVLMQAHGQQITKYIDILSREQWEHDIKW